MKKAAIIGVTGYSGIELVRLLLNHPNIRIHSIHSSSQSGVNLAGIYPHLKNIISDELEDINISKIANEVDLVFIATPSGISSKIIPELLQYEVKIIDLSGDYRLNNPNTYEKWYKHPAPAQEDINKAIYGLTEWNKEDIRNCRFISNPGCYPTATLLGLAPLVKSKLIDERSIVTDAKSGVSGAGKSLSRVTHFVETNDNLTIYKVNQHQHIPEIEQVLSIWNENIPFITFNTHLVPMTRGIMATTYANANKSVGSTEQLVDLYKTTYEDSHFVRVREPGNFPGTKEVYGTNYCDIGIAYDNRTGRITVVSVIDNLMKGAAGQAVQNANLMFDFDERAGLDHIPIYI
ncbi:N-acetyl-gamma-glutamyl-phosphate reductase [Fredinandcohnia quinoae]|uniref:N-acetyl-gamma-glutamyl-phosphate reductase n=1 Tax=Fredinandcohnia quinoae TaxID=2918902 RepID=A0AAW5E8A7_9BACI|nr:N-acetyl-gamma-glutamyl-phosphate reductase [Fredinandcohnia sp. SECRCQ15]MCH1625870.1 N-acetyl-gamma-glutamyl-phosphate reductase [Fredinandcohnia sp. SECRCQ15]